jgi:chemotaxis protein methyltransferase CheR
MEEILWEKLRELIANQIGFRIRQQDLQYFQQKINSRITELKLANVKEYYHLLDNVINENQDFFASEKLVAEREWKKLANLITNGESFFFRDRGQFDLLANQILPEIINSKREAKKKGEIAFLSLKIWSAGCSTGEEVYSLAMLISELISDLAQWNIIIIGTDINQSFLDLARKGSYKQWSFRLTDPLLKTKYFIADKTDKERWQVKPHLKNMISFYQDNLVDINNISHQTYDLDLVLCRNVFIYFDSDSIAKAVRKIAITLRPGGYFISGHAELQTIELNNFKLLSFPESIVYHYLANNREIKSLLNKDDVEQNPYSLIQTTEQDRIELIELNWQNLIKTSLDDDNNPSLLQPIINEPVSNIALKTDSIQLQLKEIETLLKQGRYSDVIQQAKQIIKHRSDVKEAYYLIAQAYANQNKLEEAKQNCDRALQIDSMYLEPLYLLAQIAEEQNNYRKAKELLKRIIYLEPLSINAYTDLGAIYCQENDLDRSQKMYQTAYDILQESSQNLKIKSQGNINIDEFITYLKNKL